MKKDILLKMKDVSVEEVLRRKIVTFGKGAHVIVPKRHIGKKVYIIIPKR